MSKLVVTIAVSVALEQAALDHASKVKQRMVALEHRVATGLGCRRAS
jgi:hypothetical protein